MGRQSVTHPVIEAIDAELERLVDVRTGMEDELGKVNAEEVALRESRERLGAALLDDETPREALPPRPTRPKETDPTDEQILHFVAQAGGSIRVGELVREMQVVHHTARRRLVELTEAGHLLKTGERSTTRYEIRLQPKPALPPEPEPEVEHPSGPPEHHEVQKNGTGTLEGRICAALRYGHMTDVELADHLHEERETLIPLLAKLKREGDIEAVKLGGRCVLRFIK